jgi:hypothetical protein
MDHKLLAVLVRKPVLGTLRDVDGVAGVRCDCPAVDLASGDPEYHDPVLGAVVVSLVGQPAAGLDVNALDLVAAVYVDNVPRALGRVGKPRHRVQIRVAARVSPAR